MRRAAPVLILLLCGWGFAQQPDPGPNQAPPRSDQRARDKEAGDSSSRDTRIDLSPPRDDAKNHPYSSASPDDEDADTSDSSDVSEFHPWDPHKALKDDEVADFYLKQKNYKAALDRYREALVYKENDAAATIGIAQCLEKMNQPEEARKYYEAYLKILPNGPSSKQAHRALEKLNRTSAVKAQGSTQAKQ
jgi:tetratricopeptide (TPR) repeat protein